MLQFVIKGHEKTSPAEVVRMALEGGCRWIQLSADAAGDNECNLKALAEAVIPVCRDHDAFLVIEDDVELVDELKVHGVFLRDNCRSTVLEARERLGAHAVIGVYAETPEEILALRGLDVDYVCVPEAHIGNDAQTLPEKYRQMIKSLREGGVDFHVVASGEFALDVLPALIGAGCAGVAMSASIADAENPKLATAMVVEALDRARFGDASGV